MGNTVDVTVTSGGNTSATGVDDEFTYTYNTTATPAPNTLSITAPATPASAVPLNQNVTLTGTAGSDVNATPYGFSLLDVTDASSPVLLAHVGSTTATVVTTGVSQSTAGTHRYVAEFDNCATAPVRPEPCPSGSPRLPSLHR